MLFQKDKKSKMGLKVNCDTINATPLQAIAYAFSKKIRFSSAISINKKDYNVSMAEWLKDYAIKDDTLPILLVDDYYGPEKKKQLDKYRTNLIIKDGKKDYIVVVAFSLTNDYPDWVVPLFEPSVYPRALSDRVF